MKINKFGPSIQIETPNPEVLKFFKDAEAASKAYSERMARFVVGADTDEDKKWLKEQSSYCQECGREFDK